MPKSREPRFVMKGHDEILAFGLAANVAMGFLKGRIEANDPEWVDSPEVKAHIEKSIATLEDMWERARTDATRR